MMTVEDLGQALLNQGFTRGKISADAASDAYIYRTGRVALAVARASLERAFDPLHQDEAGSPWPVFLKLEARWLHAADIFRKNGLPVERDAFESFLACLMKTGLFPSRVEYFWEFDPPDFLDLALLVNTKAQAEDLTPDILRERLQPLVDALVRAELFLVFAATLDVHRHELAQKNELEKIRLTGDA